MPDPMGPTLLVYAATAVAAVLYVLAFVGVLCVMGEALCRAGALPQARPGPAGQAVNRDGCALLLVLLALMWAVPVLIVLVLT